MQHFACSRSLGTSFELLSATIGPQASLLRYLDLPLKCIMEVKNWGKIEEGSSDFDPTESLVTLWAPTSVQNFIKIEQELLP